MSFEKICIEEDKPTFDNSDKDPNIVINSLDYDSLAKIIMLLPIPERIDMEKVCVKWKEACQLAWYDIKKYKCELSIERSYDNHLLTQSYLEEILLRCGNYLRELSLSDVCDSSIMPFVGDHCKNLTSLECKFNNNSLIDNADHFVQAFTQLDKLKCIKITVDHNYTNKTINLSAIINSLPEEINQIHLNSESPLPQEHIVPMTLKKFKNLQKLTLQGDYFLDNMIFQEIAEKTTLVHLSIRLYDIPEKFFLFDKLVNLEYINLTMALHPGDWSALKDKLFTKLVNTIFYACKNLKHLDIPYGSYSLDKISHEKWINFQNLEYLGIFCNIMPGVANTIVKYCKNLKHLKIHYPRGTINDTALKKLTELKNLECLILLGLPARTLSSIILDTGIELNEESIIAISNNCKKLKRLEISRCTIVPSILADRLSSPSVLDELSKLQCLEHLNLSFVENLNDSTIIAIANNCKNLKILQIRSCTAITETGLDALINLENLQKLEVGYLDIITDSFIIKLKGLKELNCDGCEKLTDAGIIQFIKNNPDLEKIDVRGINRITSHMIIGADQATKNRTNSISLHIKLSNPLRFNPNKIIITSQWLFIGYSL